MNTEWLEDAIASGVNEVLTNADPSTEQELIAQIAKRIRQRVIGDYNDLLNRLKKGQVDLLEAEREEVPA